LSSCLVVRRQVSWPGSLAYMITVWSELKINQSKNLVKKSYSWEDMCFVACISCEVAWIGAVVACICLEVAWNLVQSSIHSILTPEVQTCLKKIY
jgi:hypothetical protein